jgi:threonine/homoserine/homoserine lactone efflux protein
MTLTELSLAIAVLLITPGPTNTLLAVAGAERGALRAARLIPAELAGYLTTVIPLTLVGAGLLTRYPDVRPIITIAAAIWVMWLAWKMVRHPSPRVSQTPLVTARLVFVTTLLNPKALIFGLVLLPAEVGVWWNIANFTGQVILVALLWATLGMVLAQAGPGERKGLPEWFRRIAAIWLVIVSLGLFTRVISA